METRKIMMTGGATYIVSLPKKWVNDAGLKAGDSVVVTPQEGSIIIEPGDVEREVMKTEISTSAVPNVDALQRMIISHYLAGYDTIEVKLDLGERLDFKEGVRKVLDLLIGVEIVEDTGDSMSLEILLDHERMPTIQVLKRMHLIEKSMLSDAVAVLKSGDASLCADIISREREVDRLYFLVVRQLKGAVRYQHTAEKLGIKNQRDCLGYRIVVKSFERISDHIENIVKSYTELARIERNLESSDIIGIVSETSVIFETASAAIFGRNAQEAENVFLKIKGLRSRINDISDQLFRKKITVASAMHRKAMLDSLGRIASYSSDVAEIAMNMSVEVP